jgi:hypothetical protein
VVGTIGQSRAVVNELVRSNSERTLASDRYRDISDVLPQLECLTNITDAKSSFAHKDRWWHCPLSKVLGDHSLSRPSLKR